MLVEIAIADAYGAGFEYVTREQVRTCNTLAGYVAHPRHTGIAPGRYTDDTQMTVALAELLVSGAPFTREAVAAHFVEAFRRDPRDGYARGFQAFLSEVTSGADFLARIRPHSDKSGAAMRAGPLGLLRTVGEVVEKCTLQAKVTHDTPAGVSAALAAALAVHYCRYALGPLGQLGAFVTDTLGGGDWHVPWVGKVGEQGVMSVRAALTALMRARTYRGLLVDCVAFTGDVDTVAAVAFAAGSVCPALEPDLPRVLYDTLEDGPFGRRWLAALDGRLLAM